jgi:hypothetical protein
VNALSVMITVGLGLLILLAGYLEQRGAEREPRP